jgi:hypothetical protein
MDRPGNGKRRKTGPAARPTPIDPGTEARQQLHALSNTLASMRLRLGILAGDPACAERQGPNLAALQAIADEALQLTRGMQPLIDDLTVAVRQTGPSRRRVNGRG